MEHSKSIEVLELSKIVHMKSRTKVIWPGLRNMRHLKSKHDINDDSDVVDKLNHVRNTNGAVNESMLNLTAENSCAGDKEDDY